MAAFFHCLLDLVIDERTWFDALFIEEHTQPVRFPLLDESAYPRFLVAVMADKSIENILTDLLLRGAREDILGSLLVRIPCGGEPLATARQPMFTAAPRGRRQATAVNRNLNNTRFRPSKPQGA